MRTVTFNFLPPDAAFFVQNQTITGAGNLSLNGTGAIQNAFYGTASIATPGNFQCTVSLTSAANLSAANITLTGYDQMGNVVTEVIAGPNATTKYSNLTYAGLTNVASNVTLASNITLGTGTTGASFWFITNKHVTPFNVGMSIDVLAGTCNYTVQSTDVDLTLPQTAAPPSTRIVNSSDTNVVAATTTQVSNYMLPVANIRCLINSSSSGNLTATFTEAGIV